MKSLILLICTNNVYYTVMVANTILQVIRPLHIKHLYIYFKCMLKCFFTTKLNVTNEYSVDKYSLSQTKYLTFTKHRIFILLEKMCGNCTVEVRNSFVHIQRESKSCNRNKSRLFPPACLLLCLCNDITCINYAIAKFCSLM